MESDGNDCRAMIEQQKHKGIKGDAQKDAKAMQRAMFWVQKEFPYAGMARSGRSGRLGRRERQPEPGNTPQNRLKATHSNHRATTRPQRAKPTTKEPTLDEE